MQVQSTENSCNDWWRTHFCSVAKILYLATTDLAGSTASAPYKLKYPLTYYITAVYVPRLCHRCEVYACCRVLMLAVNPYILHVPNKVGLLILAAKLAPVR